MENRHWRQGNRRPSIQGDTLGRKPWAETKKRFFVYLFVVILAATPLTGAIAVFNGSDIAGFTEAIEDISQPDGVTESQMDDPLSDPDNVDDPENESEDAEKNTETDGEDEESEGTDPEDPLDTQEAEDEPQVQATIQNVTYVDSNGATRTTPTGTPVTELTTASIISDNYTLQSGWYIVNNPVTIPADRIQVSGSVHLILGNGMAFNAARGIDVPAGSSLTIYAQTTDASQAGSLTVASTDGPAGIGATYNEGCGTITINGGRLNVQGGSNSAGIGGSYNGSAGTVIINGGTIEATGGAGGCGIGGGYQGTGGSVQINGGTITATGNGNASNGAPGIGASVGSTGQTSIAINGGSVVASAAGNTASIGGSDTEPSLSLTGGLLVTTDYRTAVGPIHCAPLTINGGIALAVPNSTGFSVNGDGSVRVTSASVLMARGYGDGIHVPAETTVSGKPNVTLPANGTMTYPNASNRTVTIVSSATPTELDLSDPNRIFLPAGFRVTVGTNAAVTSPLHGMYLAGEGTLSIVAGTATNTTVPATNDFNATLSPSGMDLARRVLTSTELNKITGGEDVSIWLKAAQSTVPESTKELFEDETGDYTAEEFVDLSLLYRFTDQATDTSLNTTPSRVTVTFTLPEDLVTPAIEGYNRYFQLFYVDNGTVKPLQARFNASNRALSFDIDRFTVYALGYLDSEEVPEPPYFPGGEDPSGGPGTESVGFYEGTYGSSPLKDTGDTMTSVILGLFGLVFLAAIAVRHSSRRLSPQWRGRHSLIARNAYPRRRKLPPHKRGLHVYRSR